MSGELDSSYPKTTTTSKLETDQNAEELDIFSDFLDTLDFDDFEE